eukprot:3838619-Pyramimonas_sp.AAC.1
MAWPWSLGIAETGGQIFEGGEGGGLPPTYIAAEGSLREADQHMCGGLPHAPSSRGGRMGPPNYR